MSGCYSVSFIRLPAEVQKPKKPDATIRNWRTRCHVWDAGRACDELAKAKAERDQYNERSLKQGWRTWAVITVDTELRRMSAFAEALGKQAEEVMGHVSPYIFVRRSWSSGKLQFHTSLHSRGEIASPETLASDAIASVRAMLDEWEKALEPKSTPRLKLRHAV